MEVDSIPDAGGDRNDRNVNKAAYDRGERTFHSRDSNNNTRFLDLIQMSQKAMKSRDSNIE